MSPNHREQWFTIVFATLKTVDDMARLLGFVAIGYLLAYFLHYLTTGGL